jgi:hypothetical protein
VGGRLCEIGFGFGVGEADGRAHYPVTANRNVYVAAGKVAHTTVMGFVVQC